MKILVSSINKQLYQGEAESITLPSLEGQIQILPGHAPFTSLLDKGAIKIKDQVVPILRGIIQVKNDQVVVLVEQS